MFFLTFFFLLNKFFYFAHPRSMSFAYTLSAKGSTKKTRWSPLIRDPIDDTIYIKSFQEALTLCHESHARFPHLSEWKELKKYQQEKKSSLFFNFLKKIISLKKKKDPNKKLFFYDLKNQIEKPFFWIHLEESLAENSTSKINFYEDINFWKLPYQNTSNNYLNENDLLQWITTDAFAELKVFVQNDKQRKKNKKIVLFNNNTIDYDIKNVIAPFFCVQSEALSS